MTLFLSRNHKVTVGIEAVYGDGGATPTPAPLFMTAIPEANPTWHENEVYPGTMDRNTAFMGKNFFKLPGKYYLKGSGTAGTAPEIGKLIRLHGMSETVNAGVSVVYSPLASSLPSGGLIVNVDGVQWALAGCRSDSFKLAMKGGEPVLIEQDFYGLYADPTSVAYTAPTFTDTAVVPPVATGMALTIGGATFVLPEFSLELKNKLVQLPSVNAVATSRGITEMVITAREWGGKFTAIRDANNDIEFWTNARTAAEQAVVSTGFGATGNIIKVSMSNLQLTSVKPTDYEGMPAYECEYRINKNATLANVFSLTFA